VKAFIVHKPATFTLHDVFQVELENGDLFVVAFDEKKFLNLLYTDSCLYSIIGREFCLIFDIVYAKTGTEAVAESFYRVMEAQEKDGGQSFEVLRNRSIVDWSLPHTIQCEEALSEMASMYINGSKNYDIKKHYVPICRQTLTSRNRKDL